MSIQNHAGLVHSRKEGKWIFYKLSLGDSVIFPQQALTLLKSNLIDDKIIKSDAVRLKKIIKLTHEELCNL